MTERLQKALARAGVASRRTAERWIAEGRVAVNGAVVHGPGARVDPARDAITVDGRPLPRPAADRTYLMLHKPRGCITSMSDPEGRPTVAGLLRRLPGGVVPVGRLDFNSEGLLLLTDDGPLAHALTHPSRGVPKTYTARVRGLPGADELRRLRRGIALDGRLARPLSVRLLRRGATAAWIELTLAEGRKHVVRRMLQAVGLPVVRLKRVRYGPLSLGALAPGAVRPLSPAEVRKLRRSAVAPGRRTAGDQPA